MLEPVALNQTRFNAPGVAPDNRGVLLGKQGALLFASVDRLVGFFRIFCDESSMDELLPKLKIHQVRTPLMSREFLVLYAASTSYLVDRCSRIARCSAGCRSPGRASTSSSIATTAAPLGYDATALHGEPADFVLYSRHLHAGLQRGQRRRVLAAGLPPLAAAAAGHAAPTICRIASSCGSARAPA